MKKILLGIVIGVGFTFSTSALANSEFIAKVFNVNILIDGQKQTLQSQPVNINGQTYLPLRQMANLVGYDVTFKADQNVIELNDKQITLNNQQKIEETPVTKTDESSVVETTFNGKESYLIDGETYISIFNYVSLLQEKDKRYDARPNIKNKTIEVTLDSIVVDVINLINNPLIKDIGKDVSFINVEYFN